MKGWQAVVRMARHDAWHGGQISVMRDVYRAMWEEGRGVVAGAC